MNTWYCVTDGSVHVLVNDTKVLRKGVWVNFRASHMLVQFNSLHAHAKRWAIESAVEKIGYKILQEMNR